MPEVQAAEARAQARPSPCCPRRRFSCLRCSGASFGNGSLRCWGDNSAGQFGNGEADTKPHYVPEHAGGSQTFAAIAVGGGYVCGLDAYGTAYCWGDNGDSQCGPECTTTPTAMFAGHRFVALSAGGKHTCGLDKAGTAYCWGSNANGALGTIDDLTLTFNQVSGGPFKAIAAGQDNTCALTTDGTAYCWGLDASSVLGNTGDAEPCSGGCGGQGVGGAPSGIYAPAPVSGALRFASIWVNAFNACGVDTEGAGWCWGENDDGQLGDGTFGADQAAPVRYQVPRGVLLQQMVPMWPTCALSVTGDVYCAGANQHGALGLGTADMNPHPTPTLVPGLPPIVDIAGDNFAVCALTADGKRYCWGNNALGALGDGTTTDRWSPELTP